MCAVALLACTWAGGCSEQEAQAPAAAAAAPEAPLRVVSLAPAASEWIVDLGAVASLVAVDRTSARLPELDGLPVTSLDASPDLSPDLVLVPRQPLRDAAVAAQLRAGGIEVIEVAPRDYDEVFALCRGLGVRLAGEAQALAFASDLGRALGALGAAAPAHDRPRVAAVRSTDPFELAPAHGFETDLIELAGGTSTAHDHTLARPPQMPAELAASAPDLVLVVRATPWSDAEREAARHALGGTSPVAFFPLDPQRFWARGSSDAVRRLRAVIEAHTGPDPQSRASGAEGAKPSVARSPGM